MAEKKAKEQQEIEPQEGTVGAMLRAARKKKDLSLEEVSKALRIRAAQLKVIEENNVDALPGMTYAVGFVRSYANYLGLNGAEVVQQFKAEHGQDNEAKLTFPEPVSESRMPDPIMIGIGAFLAIVVLVVWSIASNTTSDTKMADVSPVTTTETPVDEPTETLATATPAAPATAAALVGAAGTPAVTAPAAETPAAPVVAETKTDATAAAPAATEAAAAKTETKVEVKPEVAAAAPATEAPKAAEAKPAATEEAAKAEKAKTETAATDEPKAEVINVKRGKTRITLQSTQASWIQITDVRKGVIFKKVLRPGETYSVPDQTGLSLVTANAGGIDVYVDGQKAQPVGRVGEIVRGVVLDPEQLKRKRIRVND